VQRAFGIVIAVPLVVFLAATGHPAAQAIAEPVPGQPGKDVVWVPTPPELVEKMLDMAGVTTDDVVVDLGSGDGRTVIAAARRGARAIGVEFNPDLVELSRKRAAEAGVADKAAFVVGDMYRADLSEATVLALFLTPEHLDGLQQNFLAMKPGTRIVMNTFPVTDWEPDATETLGPPCKVWCTALLVVVPARVEGTWEMGGTRMNLRQDYQFVRGTIGARQVTGRLRGSDITLRAGDTEFAGLVSGGVIEGTETTAGRRTAWRTTRVAGQP
jgi:SAM-dependent methyltransferase